MQWTDFLQTFPPNTKAIVIGACTSNTELVTPQLLLHCNECSGERQFRCSRPEKPEVHKDRANDLFLYYVCRNCGKDYKMFAVRVQKTNESWASPVIAIKLGQSPPFGPVVPSRVRSLIGTDQELFNKALASESAGLGIGAFTYYRRIVDDQWKRLLNEIIKVAEKVDNTAVELLRKAHDETQFDRAVKMVKGAIPQVLLINGHNPITLLYTALSEGLHAQTDEECLQLAQDIRLVLYELADRIGVALKDHAELNKAIGRLVNTGRAKSKEDR